MEAIDRMSDVTVHIDPEDDETAVPTKGLPMRAEVLRDLEQRWRQIPEAQTRKRLMLHYLEGAIAVDLFLPLRVFIDEPSAQQLRHDLKAALVDDPRYGDVHVYFG
jgi:hypothetical protein